MTSAEPLQTRPHANPGNHRSSVSSQKVVTRHFKIVEVHIDGHESKPAISILAIVEKS